MVFCKNCGKTIEPGIKFCENCGTPVDDQPTPRVMPPPTSQGPPAAYPVLPRGAPMAGIANKFVGRFPLYTVIGVGGIALFVLSFFVPFVNEYQTSLYDSLYQLIAYILDGNFVDARVSKIIMIILQICTLAIGIAGGAFGLYRLSWKVTVLSGLISVITPVCFIVEILIYYPDYDIFELLSITWLIISLLGVVLLVFSGYLMRYAAPPLART